MTTRHLALPLALALALAIPTSVQAIGLGQLEVKSGLNQPLLAEIPIISANADELEQLEIRLASPEAFARVGLERPTALTTNLQFSVGKNSQGQSIIQVSTLDKFMEPFLSFLIEADWGKGRVTREYTALIDPPYIAAAVIQPMQTPAIANVAIAAPAPMPLAPVTPEIEPTPQTTPLAAPEAVAAEPVPAPPAPLSAMPQAKPMPAAAQLTEIGPVRSGQTLSEIAHSMRQDQGASLNQMMLALLRANPDAFIGDNINRLKSGSVLRIPSHEEAISLSTREATALVHEQINTWRSARQPVPQPGGSVAEPGMTPPSIAKATKASAAPLAKSGKSVAPNVSRLEIVPPSGKASARAAQSGAAAGAGGAELRVELVQAHEELVARTAEVTELKSRVADMEKQDADRQRLLEMKNSQLNDLEKRLKQMEADNAANAKRAVADPSTPALSAAVATSTPSDTAAMWYFNPFLLGGGSLVLIGGLAMLLRRSKPGSKSEIHVSRLSQDEALLASMASTYAESTQVDSDRSGSDSDSAVPFITPVVDVERQTLEEEVQSHPKDLESHLNLLRYHYAKNKPADFEAAAHAMRLQIKNTIDPRWREVVIMGAALVPENALFSHAGWNSRRYSDVEPTPAFSDPVVGILPTSSPRSSTAKNEAINTIDTSAPEDQGIDLTPLSAYAGDAPVDIYRHEAEAIAGHEGSATRLELAKAYLDIGDIEGARGMLEEVLAEGGAEAKAEAERILSEIQ